MTWANASMIAVIAMGREHIHGGKSGHWIWKADIDPLAAWCLTELIHAEPVCPDEVEEQVRGIKRATS